MDNAIWLRSSGKKKRDIEYTIGIVKLQQVQWTSPIPHISSLTPLQHKNRSELFFSFLCWLGMARKLSKQWMIGIYRQAPKSVLKNHPKPLKNCTQMIPKLRKFQNWRRDLGADFPDLVFLKLFGMFLLTGVRVLCFMISNLLQKPSFSKSSAVNINHSGL